MKAGTVTNPDKLIVRLLPIDSAWSETQEGVHWPHCNLKEVKDWEFKMRMSEPIKKRGSMYDCHFSRTLGG